MTIGNFVEIESYIEPPISRREIARYAGGKECDELSALIDSCLSEALPQLSYRVCRRTFQIKLAENVIDMGFARVHSADLAKNLTACNEMILFAATIGIGIDRLISKYSKLSPAKALVMQAIGAERIEALCNLFCRDLENSGLILHPRFSPGYGDLPLEFQKDIFAILDCNRKIGLTLSRSMLMSPTKSVTAIVGIENR